MKLVLISDTHRQHRKIIVPDGDVLIHAGDATWRGEMEEIQEFGRWMAEQPHRLKIFVAGNHDLMFEKNPDSARNLLPKEITYLQDSGIIFEGVNFYGSPWQPRFFDWAFNLDRGAELAKKWSMIPDETNVLITHSPPFGTGDTVRDWNDPTHKFSVGCEELAKRTAELKDLKLHVFGHIHEQRGIYGKCVNAATLNDKYKNPQPPFVVEI